MVKEQARKLTEMAHRAREVLVILFLAVLSKAVSIKLPGAKPRDTSSGFNDASFCLSWRLGVEANNVRAWRTVPTQCLRHVETYMIGGQYDRDLELIVDQILTYVDSIVLSHDAMDAWILDVDDTCISNVYYYKGKRYGYAIVAYYIYIYIYIYICIFLHSYTYVYK